MKRGRCGFPRKDRLTQHQAEARAAALNGRHYDGRLVRAYRCGDHWHVGHYGRRRAR